jgi:hypothetical protein
VIEADPLQNPPPHENLVGDLADAYFQRTNVRHRLVYEIFPKQRSVGWYTYFACGRTRNDGYLTLSVSL